MPRHPTPREHAPSPAGSHPLGRALHADPERARLLALSCRVGADPALVQGPGGNTSVKLDGTLWIKASGTWLAHAGTDDILVPVALAPLLEAFERGDPAAEKATAFVVDEANPSGLRPSIETTVHALVTRRIVVHVHCVETIAHAVLVDAEASLAPRLDGLRWCWVPYARPGLPLAREIVARHGRGCDVLVLGNHGLVIAADTVDAAAALLAEVPARLAIVPRRPDRRAAPDRLRALAGDAGYAPPADERCHDVALDPVALACVDGVSLYPDHVIFLGAGTVVAQGNESVEAVLERVRARDPDAAPPPAILVRGLGVLVRTDASAGTLALLRCLADVASRLPGRDALRVLGAGEEHELLHWEAEAYRRALAPGGP